MERHFPSRREPVVGTNGQVPVKVEQRWQGAWYQEHVVEVAVEKMLADS